MRPPFAVFDGAGSVMATAIHGGHNLRPEICDLIAIDEEVRLREEDPYTDVLTDVVPRRVVVDRSRFEVDLNRPRREAIYLSPDEAWGLDVWKQPLDHQTVSASLEMYDAFYRELSERLDLMAELGPFVVLDIHSYNHRRSGAELPPDDPTDNPDVNIGTGSVDRTSWAGLIESFAKDLQTGLPAEATVAENVRFQGGHFSRWVNERYPGRGCALALEFKKTFMDEWSGEVDRGHLDRLRVALADTVPGLESELEVRQ